MIGDTVGYCVINKNATTCIAKTPKSFLGDTCRVMEFAEDGGALVLNRQGTELAMFDKCDIGAKFECCEKGDVIMDPKLKEDFLGQMMYMNKAMSRKGGYNYMVKQIVIASSLHKGEFNDKVLWAVENEKAHYAEYEKQQQAQGRQERKESEVIVILDRFGA